MARRGSRRRAARPPSSRRYPRTARLNTLLTEIIAAYFERTDDEAVGFLTVTGVEVDADLNQAQTFVTVLDGWDDPEEEQALLESLNRHRVAVQRAIADQAKLRKTPEVVFRFDPAIKAGARIERILADLEPDDDADVEGG